MEFFTYFVCTMTIDIFNKASPSSLYKPTLFLSNLFAKLLKETSPQFHKPQPHRKLPLLHEIGWCFSFATEFPCSKGVIFWRAV